MSEIGLKHDLRGLNIDGLDDDLVRKQRTGFKGEGGLADTDGRGRLESLGIAHHQTFDNACPGKQRQADGLQLDIYFGQFRSKCFHPALDGPIQEQADRQNGENGHHDEGDEQTNNKLLHSYTRLLLLGSVADCHF
jgi:hypothetical protein